MDGIEIEDNEYDPTEVFIDSDTKVDDDTPGTPIISGLTTLSELAAKVSETNSDFDHIYGHAWGASQHALSFGTKVWPQRKKS